MSQPIWNLSPDSIVGLDDDTIFTPPGVLFGVDTPPPPGNSMICSGWATRNLPFCPWWFLPLLILPFLICCMCMGYIVIARKRRRYAYDEELGEPICEDKKRQSAIFAMNMMNTSPSMEVEECEDEEFFTQNPLSELIPARHTASDLGLRGWCQCTDSQNKEFFIHETTGAVSYTMPDEQVRHRLSIQHGCMVKLTSALSALAVDESDTELQNIRVQIQSDLSVIEVACGVVSQSIGSATETTDALARADTTLTRLEELATMRVNGSLWGIARDALGPQESVSNAWSMLLDNISRVRENLRPVQAATEAETDDKEEQNAWVRSLRNKLKPLAY